MQADSGASVLEGVRVLEVGGEIGAWCGKLLGDMGADVVKVEPPAGDPTRGYEPFYQNETGPDRSLFFWHYNASKRGITLDVTKDQGREVFKSLVAKADVLVDGTPAGFLKSLGLGYSDVRGISPSIVMVSMSPFGQDGPFSDYAATDLTAMAFGGPVWSTGYDDHSIPPVRGGGNQAYHTVCHYAAIGVMIALIHRQFTGVGQFIDANMHASLNVSTESGSYGWLVAKQTVQRQTGRHAAPSPTSQAQFLCKDGRYINAGMAFRTEAHWQVMLEWLREEGLIDILGDYLKFPDRAAVRRGDPNSKEQGRRVSSAVQQLAAKNNAHDLFMKAQELDFQWGIINAPEDVLADPHFQARGFPTEVDHPELGETFIYAGAPYNLPESPWSIQRRAPLLGEHNEQVYVGEMGMSHEELASLEADEII